MAEDGAVEKGRKVRGGWRWKAHWGRAVDRREESEAEETNERWRTAAADGAVGRKPTRARRLTTPVGRRRSMAEGSGRGTDISDSDSGAHTYTQGMDCHPLQASDLLCRGMWW